MVNLYYPNTKLLAHVDVRTLLYMRDDLKYTYKQISEAVGDSVSTIRRILGKEQKVVRA